MLANACHRRMRWTCEIDPPTQSSVSQSVAQGMHIKLIDDDDGGGQQPSEAVTVASQTNWFPFKRHLCPRVYWEFSHHRGCCCCCCCMPWPLPQWAAQWRMQFRIEFSWLTELLQVTGKCIVCGRKYILNNSPVRRQQLCERSTGIPKCQWSVLQHSRKPGRQTHRPRCRLPIPRHYPTHWRSPFHRYLRADEKLWFIIDAGV